MICVLMFLTLMRHSAVENSTIHFPDTFALLCFEMYMYIDSIWRVHCVMIFQDESFLEKYAKRASIIFLDDSLASAQEIEIAFRYALYHYLVPYETSSQSTPSSSFDTVPGAIIAKHMRPRFISGSSPKVHNVTLTFPLGLRCIMLLLLFLSAWGA